MADFNLGTARGHIEIDSSKAEYGIKRAEKAAGSLDDKFGSASRNMMKAGAVTAGVGVAIVAGFGLAVNAAANFEQRISAIGAVSGASAAELDVVRKKALQLGADTKFSAGEAASAMEELIKAGLSVADTMNGAADATVALAAAGEIDLTTAATIASNAMNSFALAAQDLPHVADLLAGAANASAIDVMELGQSLQQVGAVAHTAGMSIDDTIVAIAELGNAGIKGSDAGTSLKTFLQRLVPSSKEAAEEMKRLGLVTKDGSNQFFDAKGNIKSMADIQATLQKALQGSTKEQQLATFHTLFGADAIRAAAVFTEQGAAGFTKMAESMGKVSAADVAAKRMDNLKGSMEQLKGSVETAAITFGQSAQGPVRALVDALTKLVNWFANLSPQAMKNVQIALLVAAAFATLIGTFLLVGGVILKVVNTFKELNAAFKVIKQAQLMTNAMKALNASFLTNPVFLIVAALVALGVGLYLLYKRSETFRNAVDSLWQGVQKAFKGIKKAIAPVLDWIGDRIRGIVQGFKAFQAAFSGEGITTGANKIVGVFERIGVAARAVFDFFKNNWRLIAGLLLSLLGPIGIVIAAFLNFNKIKEIVGNVVNSVVGFFMSLPGRVVAALAGLGGAFLQALAALPAALGFMVGYLIGSVIRLGLDIVQAIIEYGPKLLVAIGEAFVAVFNFFTELPGKVLDLLGNTLEFLVTSGRNLLTGLWNGVKAVAASVLTYFKELPGNFLRGMGAIATFLYDAGSKLISGLWNGIKFVADQVVTYFRELPGRFLKGLGNIASFLYEAGKDLLTGFWNGIKSMFGKIKDSVGGFLGGLVSGAKRALGEKSPSKITDQMGVYFMQGFIDGMKRQEEAVRRTAEAVLRSAIVPLNGTVGLSAAATPGLRAAAGNSSANMVQAEDGSWVPQSFYGGDRIEVNVQTNADSMQIAKDIFFEKRIRTR